jgi:hypothetical protein
MPKYKTGFRDPSHSSDPLTLSSLSVTHPQPPWYNPGCDPAMEQPSLPGIDKGPGANEKSALADVV